MMSLSRLFEGQDGRVSVIRLYCNWFLSGYIKLFYFSVFSQQLINVQNPSGGSKHQISPITENSEPESCSSHESQPIRGQHTGHMITLDQSEPSLIFKMSEESNAVNIATDENETRGQNCVFPSRNTKYQFIYSICFVRTSAKYLIQSNTTFLFQLRQTP